MTHRLTQSAEKVKTRPGMVMHIFALVLFFPIHSRHSKLSEKSEMVCE